MSAEYALHYLVHFACLIGDSRLSTPATPSEQNPSDDGRAAAVAAAVAAKTDSNEHHVRLHFIVSLRNVVLSFLAKNIHHTAAPGQECAEADNE